MTRPAMDATVPLQRLSLPADEDLQVRLVWTRQEEEALKREGWREVPHE